MKYLEKLRARLKEIKGELDAFADKEDLSAEEIKKIGALTKEQTEVEADIGKLEEAEQARARAAKPAQAPADGTKVKDDLKEPKARIGLVVAGMIHALREEGTRGARSTLRAIEELGYPVFAREFEASQKRTLNAGSASAGGILLPENMATDLIDLLRPTSTFLAGNPQEVPMPNGTYKQSAAASGATAGYRGEGKPMSVSTPTFKSISMSAKLLAGIVPLTQQLMRWSLPNISNWVESDLVAAMNTAMDIAAFRGSGLQDNPLGITLIPGVLRQACVSATTSTPTVAQIESDARLIEAKIDNSGLQAPRAEWRMSWRTFSYLADLRDGNGNRIYPELQGANPTWRRRPVRYTQNIPTNLGGGTNESEIYLVAFNHVLFGNTLAMQLAMSDVATVVNGSQTINSFQDGVTVIKAEWEHDFDVRYVEAVAVLTGVKF